MLLINREEWEAALNKIGARQQPVLSDPYAKKIAGAFKSNGISSEDLTILSEKWKSKYPFVDETGRPFALYIYDQALAFKFHGSTRKFHVCWCSVLDTMENAGRRSRYKGKYDVDNNIFSVYRGESEIDARIPLQVCKVCLMKLNYEGYASSYPLVRNKIYQAFDITGFFKEHGPQDLKNPTHQFHTGGHTSDWAVISAKIRREKNYTCENCGICCKNNTSQVHVHHRNGVKSDNNRENLVVLCQDCHSKESYHGHMRRRNN